MQKDYSAGVQNEILILADASTGEGFLGCADLCRSLHQYRIEYLGWLYFAITVLPGVPTAERR